MNKILLIGASGFIGKRVLDLCLSSKHATHIVTRNASKFFSISPKVKIHEADLTDVNDLKRIGLSQFDVIINCSGELKDESLMRHLHVGAIEKILPMLSPSAHWIQLSSVGVYGSPRKPYVSNGDEFSPKGEYEVTKAEGEIYLEEYCRASSLTFSIIRPSIVFANDMPNNSIRMLINTIVNKKFIFFSDGKETYLNYIHADDVAKVVFDSILYESAISRSINISDKISLYDFFTMVVKLKNITPYYRFVPKWLAYPLVIVFSVLPGFPLTSSRLDALTSKTIYISDIDNSTSFRESLEDFILNI